MLPRRAHSILRAGRLPAVHKVELDVHVHVAPPHVVCDLGNQHAALVLGPAEDLANEAQGVGLDAHGHVLALVAADFLHARIPGPGADGDLGWWLSVRVVKTRQTEEQKLTLTIFSATSTKPASRMRWARVWATRISFAKTFAASLHRSCQRSMAWAFSMVPSSLSHRATGSWNSSQPPGCRWA